MHSRSTTVASRTETDHGQGFLFIPATHLYPPQHLTELGTKTILMVEDLTILSRRPYHQQKLALLLAAMRNYRKEISQLGLHVNYHELDENHTIRSGILSCAASLGVDRFSTFAVTDHALRASLEQIAKDGNLTWLEFSDPGFIDPIETFKPDLQGRALRMDSYYKQKRKRLNIMVDSGGKPDGGRWSFDADNRKKINRKQSIPLAPKAAHDQQTLQTIIQIQERFPENPGCASDLWLPTDRAGAQQWLETFVNERLRGFGTYEDAISQRGWLLFHSGLSPLMNIGLVTPVQVLDAVMQESDVAINDQEGFVRQVLGWREFVRGVYMTKSGRGALQNKRVHTRSLTQHWYNGTTGLPPLDDAIKTMLHRGWNHHIERLMVFANIMNLCEINPQEVYDYFMTHHIDAYAWVMRPNVEDMGLSSSTDTFATKPYICGSNYLLKMSDYTKGPWCDVIDGLYWRFVSRNKAELASNVRTVMATKTLDRMNAERKLKIGAAADAFLERCTIPN